MPRTLLRITTLLATGVAALAAAAPASAGEIVYSAEPGDGDSQIRVMNEDGSNDRLLVHENDIPGAEAVYRPYVSPDGATVVFQARTPGPGSGGIYCGFRCSGIYAYSGGHITRISQNAIDCPPGDLCLGLDTDPRITGDGQNVFYELVYGEPGGQYGTPQTTSTNYYRTMTPGDGNEVELPPTSCGEGDNVTPNPQVNGQFATSVYCVGTGGNYALITKNVTGPGEQIIGYDDRPFTKPAFRGDGQMLVGAEEGNDPGIWMYPRNGTNPTRLVNVTWDSDASAYNSSPSFMGSHGVVFVHGETIRTVPTSCNSCSLGSTGSLGSVAGIDGVAWTSQHLPDPVRAADPAPQPQTSVGPPAGPNVPKPVTPKRATALATLKAPGKAKLRSVLRKGLKVPFVATRKGKLTMQATITGKLAKKLRLVRKATKKPVVIARGAVTVKKAGTATVTLKFTKAAKKRLKRAKSVPVSLSGTFAGQKVAGKTRLAR